MVLGIPMGTVLDHTQHPAFASMLWKSSLCEAVFAHTELYCSLSAMTTLF